jgi:CBS domain-containing protein
MAQRFERRGIGEAVVENSSPRNRGLMSIRNILDRKGTEVFTIDPTATVRAAAYLMRARGIAALVVKSSDATSGLILERGVVHAIAQHGERALSMAVLDTMTRSAITVTPSVTLKRP